MIRIAAVALLVMLAATLDYLAATQSLGYTVPAAIVTAITIVALMI